MEIPVTKSVQEVADIITSGRIAAVPTGTAYALVCDALQGHALQRLRNLKKRPEEKSFTVFLDPKLEQEYFEITPQEQQFLDSHRNQPLTLLLQPKTALQHLAQDDRVGLRVIDHSHMQTIAEILSVPLTATSANVSGTQACYDVQCIAQAFPPVAPDGTTYDLSLGAILGGDKLSEGKISTIVVLDKTGTPKVIREGYMNLPQ